MGFLVETQIRMKQKNKSSWINLLWRDVSFCCKGPRSPFFYVALDRKKNRKERIFLPFLDSKGLSFASEDQTFCERLLRFFSFSENHRKVAADEFPNLS